MGRAEPEVVAVCRAVRAERESPAVFDAAFARATVFVERQPSRPGVVARRLPGKGSWVLAFSTEQRLGQVCGEVAWLSTTGADLLGLLPYGLGILFDVNEPHGLPLLPQPEGRARFDGSDLPPRAGHPGARNG